MQIVHVSFTVKNKGTHHQTLRLSNGSRQAAINEALNKIADLWGVPVADVTIIRLT